MDKTVDEKIIKYNLCFRKDIISLNSDSEFNFKPIVITYNEILNSNSKKFNEEIFDQMCLQLKKMIFEEERQ